MKKVLLAVLVACAACAAAQTISPPIAEYGKKANGSFTLRNESPQAQTVTVEARSFTPGTGGPTLRALDPTAHVDLSEMSARVQPGQDHGFDYHIRCDAYPCNVMFLVGIMAGKTAQGFAVRLVVTHAVYVCERAKACRVGELRAAGVQ